MTLRKHFLQTMHYQHPKKIPNFKFGYWAETLPRWHSENLPKEINDEASAYGYFGIENFAWYSANLNVNPSFEYQVIREDENYLTYRDERGIISQVTKKNRPFHTALYRFSNQGPERLGGVQGTALRQSGRQNSG